MTEFEVGQLAQQLNRGYLAYAGIQALLRHPASMDVVAQIEAANTGPVSVPIETIPRKDGTAHLFSLSAALRNIAQDPSYLETHHRLWLGGALLTLGDALAREQYFDKAPDLEFIRHLRNGVAHGNRFHFERGALHRPARFTGARGSYLDDSRAAHPQTFELTAALQGQPVLFDFVGPGDVCDLLIHVSSRLIAIGNGDPPRIIFPQRV